MYLGWCEINFMTVKGRPNVYLLQSWLEGEAGAESSPWTFWVCGIKEISEDLLPSTWLMAGPDYGSPFSPLRAVLLPQSKRH